MNSPCWHCEKRTVAPNCHAECEQYLAFLGPVKAKREARQKVEQALDDIKTVRKKHQRLSIKIKKRAKGEKE